MPTLKDRVANLDQRTLALSTSKIPMPLQAAAARLALITAIIDDARRQTARLINLADPPGIASHVTDLARALDCAQAMADNIRAALREPTRTPKPCRPQCAG